MWPFKQKRKSIIPIMIFKTGQGFFEYHCKYMDTKIRTGKPLAAIVLDAKAEFGAQVAVKTDERGIQTATLRVASNDGGFITVSQTLSAKGEALNPGDVVAWVPGPYNVELARGMGNERSGWVGLILAKVAPEIDVSSGEMKVICRY
jgi:hypothetical protein